MITSFRSESAAVAEWRRLVDLVINGASPFQYRYRWKERRLPVGSNRSRRQNTPPHCSERTCFELAVELGRQASYYGPAPACGWFSTRAITLAMVKVLPDCRSRPASVWQLVALAQRPSPAASMAWGWSPVGAYSECNSKTFCSFCIRTTSRI